MITEAQIQAVVQRIVESYAPDRIILFGSYAYGMPTENSDLNVLLIKQHAEAKRAERAIAIWSILWGVSLPPMDILIRTPAEMAQRAKLYYTVEAQALEKGNAFVCQHLTKRTSKRY